MGIEKNDRPTHDRAISPAMTPRGASAARLELERLEASTSATCVFDDGTWQCIAMNDAALVLFGYTREEFSALTYGDVVHPAEGDANVLPRTGVTVMPRHCGTKRHIKKSGEEFLADVLAQDVVFGGRNAVLMLIIDRSDTARTQALLRQREALFSALVEHSPDVIARIDRELRHVYVNPAVAAVTGIAPDDLIGKSNRQLGVPLELCMRWAAGARRVFATGRQQDIQITYATADGTRYYESRMAPEFGADGKVESVLAIARDVTDRRRSELSARAQESAPDTGPHGVEALVDALPEAITCYDRELRHVYANASVERVTGFKPSALMRRSHAEAGFAPDTARLWDNCIRRVFETGEPENLEFVYESPAGARAYDASHIPLKNEGGEVTAVLRVAYDISERKRAEEERLASITRQRDAFVREVHHRVKNNLQGVVGLLRQLANNDSALSAILEKAISQLLAMAVVHGVNGRELHDGVGLAEMASEIAKSVELTAGRPVYFYPQPGGKEHPRLAANEAVPVALVLNELMFNAAKHGAGTPEEEPVKVEISGDLKSARIAVSNAGALPRQFDYRAGKGLGTGLELVRALVPAEGAALSFSGDNGRVKAVLDLAEPLLAASADTMEQTRHEWDRRKRSYSDRRR